MRLTFNACSLHLKFLCVLVFLATMAGCSNTPQKQKPAELLPNLGLMVVKQAWVAKTGDASSPLDVRVSEKQVTIASVAGSVAVLDASTGAEIWRAAAGTPLATGAGYDGQVAAVVTRNNELLALASGRELWRQQLTAQSYTAPLVAGGRVFVLAADRSISAYDGQSGRRLWSQQRPGEALVLRQPGVMLAVGDTLVIGLSGKLLGMNPLNGSVRWEAPIASPRGTNDVERLVDLVGPANRQGNVVCVRAFQSAVGCTDANRGTLLWSKPAAGSVGVSGDERLVVGVEADGTLIAWQRSDGERAWAMEQLRHRQLSAPLVIEKAVVVGDGMGFLHFLSRENGTSLTRITTDGSPILGTPVWAGNTVVVVTRNGNIFGFKPE